MNYTAEQIRQMTVEYNQKLKEYENNERYKRKAKCTICGDPLRFHNPRDDPNATFYTRIDDGRRVCSKPTCREAVGLPPYEQGIVEVTQSHDGRNASHVRRRQRHRV